MKALIRRLFNAAGLDIRTLQDPAWNWSYTVEAREKAEIAEVLQTLAAAPYEKNSWLDPKSVKQYLSNRRIGFYHLLVERCSALGVEFDGRDVADVGAGPGYVLRLIARRSRPANLVGYDVSTNVVQLAPHFCPEARFIQSDVFDIANVTYDVVLSMEVLEHMRRPELALRHLRGLVRSGGALVLTVPNGRVDQTPAKELYGSGQAYDGHINFWSPESWPVFLQTTLPDCRIHAELLPSGHNLAVLRMP